MSNEFDPDYSSFFGGYRAPVNVEPKKEDTASEDVKTLQKELKEVQQDVTNLKSTLKAIMDLLGKQSNHPLY